MQRRLMYRGPAALIALVLLTAIPTAHASWGVGVRASTLGLGVDLSRSLIPLVNARIGINSYTHDFEFDTDDFDYDADLKLRSAHALADFHPWAGRFRLTGGLLYNRNRIEATGRDNGNEVKATIDFRRNSPYLGIGWGNATRGFVPLSWSIDLGVVMQGAPSVSLSGDGVPGLDDEEDELEDELSEFDTYPVVSVGLIFRF